MPALLRGVKQNNDFDHFKNSGNYRNNAARKKGTSFQFRNTLSLEIPEEHAKQSAPCRMRSVNRFSRCCKRMQQGAVKFVYIFPEIQPVGAVNKCGKVSNEYRHRML